MTTPVDWSKHDPFIVENWYSMTNEEIAAHVGVHVNTILVRARKLELPRKIKGRTKGSRTYKFVVRPKVEMVKEKINRQAPLTYVPKPATLTGRILGDPVPGRSALDKRNRHD